MFFCDFEAESQEFAEIVSERSEQFLKQNFLSAMSFPLRIETKSY